MADLPADHSAVLGDLYRHEYGRMLATLIRVTRDITLAEDSLPLSSSGLSAECRLIPLPGL
ncbi:MAG TPA: hypothetical protein PLN52_00600 [Opitutaceae bacterium]|nr:hypothetical protein [Opitutaceae bacterium]